MFWNGFYARKRQFSSNYCQRSAPLDDHFQPQKLHEKCIFETLRNEMKYVLIIKESNFNEITRKSTHRCARLTCITWLTYITCITSITWIACITFKSFITCISCILVSLLVLVLLILLISFASRALNALLVLLLLRLLLVTLVYFYYWYHFYFLIYWILENGKLLTQWQLQIKRC